MPSPRNSKSGYTGSYKTSRLSVSDRITGRITGCSGWRKEGSHRPGRGALCRPAVELFDLAGQRQRLPPQVVEPKLRTRRCSCKPADI